MSTSIGPAIVLAVEPFLRHHLNIFGESQANCFYKYAYLLYLATVE